MVNNIESFILLLPVNFWFLVLLPQLGNVVHSPFSAPPPGIDILVGMRLLPRNNAN